MGEENVCIFPKCPNCGKGIYFLFHTRKMFLRNGDVLNAGILYRKDNLYFIKNKVRIIISVAII